MSFIIGLLVGGIAGFFAAACCSVASEDRRGGGSEMTDLKAENEYLQNRVYELEMTLEEELDALAIERCD